MILHNDRYSTAGVSTTKAGVVVHTNEGPDGSGPSLIAFLGRPGDRPSNGPSGRYGAGYHAVATPDGYVVVADDTAGPYHAPPLNGTWLAIVIPGYARQSRDEWLDAGSRPLIRGTARYIVDSSRRHHFPLERLTVDQLRAGGRGIVDHNTVSRAFGKTNHWDPGPSFPWDVLFDDITAIVTELAPPPPPAPPIPVTVPGPASPAEEDPMRLIQPFDGLAADPAIFVATGHLATWVADGNLIPELKAAGASCEPGGNPWPVARGDLKRLYLVGPVPTSGNTIGSDFAGRL
jgi:hypothetical protein